MQNVFSTKKEVELYQEKYEKLYESEDMRRSVWDFQWNYTIQSNNGLCIMPAKNLVTNIGIYGVHGNGQGRFHNRKCSEDFKITSHPSFVLPDREFDLYHFSFFRKIIVPSFFKGLDKRIIRKIERIMN